ncbi:MAG: SDR family oxidoreductase [Pedobacter sp.]|nr:MAG: SDR family oxidoreductase [Pedobacter sp.]
MQISLHNRHAVICGSTQGIGLATAIALASSGANCTLIARNEQSLKEAVTQLPVADGQQHGYQIADFSDPNAVDQAIKTIISNPVHILVNNSGGPKAGPITDAAAIDFTAAFQQHIVNNQNLVNAVLPGMKAAGYGRIINIVSTSVKTPLANLGVSNTIRAAVAGWSKTLANEIGQFNITVNNVLPGLTDTARLQSLVENTAKNSNTTTEQVEKDLLASIPMHRFGKAEEIANVIAFLASPAAAYVNGTNIPVDGGRTPAF